MWLKFDALSIDSCVLKSMLHKCYFVELETEWNESENISNVSHCLMCRRKRYMFPSTNFREEREREEKPTNCTFQFVFEAILVIIIQLKQTLNIRIFNHGHQHTAHPNSRVPNQRMNFKMNERMKTWWLCMKMATATAYSLHYISVLRQEIPLSKWSIIICGT